MNILLFMTSFVSGLIFCDTNLYTGFDNVFNTSFNCYQNSRISTIFFSDSFPEIPKIILSLEKIDMSSTNSQFFLEITDIQLTYFQLKISCLQRVYAIRIKWYAICGSSFEVINYISTSEIVNKTFSHSLSNAKNAFVTLTGLQYSGKVDFLLTISEFTSSSISVQITKVDGKFLNLLKIGYQVVITEQDILNLGLQTTLALFTSQAIDNKSDSWFIFNLQGLNYSTTDNIRLNLTYSYNSNTISYQFGKWDGLHTGSSHSQLWLRCLFNYFICVQLKTQRKLVSNIHELPDMKIVFIDLNLQYFNIGQNELILNQIIPFLQIEVSVKCLIGKMIESSIHQANVSNQLQMVDIKYKCQKQFNFITFYLAFTSVSLTSYKFKIKITTQSIELVQVHQHQIETEQLLMKIQQLDL